jgi:hypothetical protein
MTDQNKGGCCRQQADAKTEEQAAVAVTRGCGCDNEPHGKEHAAAVAVQPQETSTSKQGCCC